jgi:ABC-type transport system substrate-binding protein
MFQWAPGVNENPVGGAIVPDASESFEVSPDGLTITFKLRQDMKFDPRPPTNGRAVTTQDVEFSWNRLVNNGLTRFDYANELSPAGPIKDIRAVDDTTVVCEMAFPIANMVSRFAFHRFLSILPSEADGGFDSQNDQRGSGPWRLQEWEPSVGYTYVRNPEWHMRPGQPFFETLEMPIITEIAQLRAQLQAGAIWNVVTGANGIPATDVLDAKQETPALGLYDDGYPWGGPNHLSFGFAAGNPFQDERVRRAMSMVIDRELWIGGNYNVDLFESAGLPMETRWNTHYSADDAAYWLDPQGSELGEGAAYFQFNVEEATKLMRAAGHDSALAMPGQMSGNGNNQIASLHGMLQESGLFDISLVSLSSADYAATVWNSTGNFEGIAMAQNMGVRGDIDQYLSTRWSPGGASGTQSMFPEVYSWYQKAQDLITAQRQELDEEKRLGIIAEVQKELALQMPTVPYPGAANGFSVAWPRLANYGVFRAVYDFEAIFWTRYWHDESKA